MNRGLIACRRFPFLSLTALTFRLLGLIKRKKMDRWGRDEPHLQDAITIVLTNDPLFLFLIKRRKCAVIRKLSWVLWGFFFFIKKKRGSVKPQLRTRSWCPAWSRWSLRNWHHDQSFLMASRGLRLVGLVLKRQKVRARSSMKPFITSLIWHNPGPKKLIKREDGPRYARWRDETWCLPTWCHFSFNHKIRANSFHLKALKARIKR